MNNNLLKLTQREQDIVSLLQQGKLDKEISSALGISILTVKKHLQNVYKSSIQGTGLKRY